MCTLSWRTRTKIDITRYSLLLFFHLFFYCGTETNMRVPTSTRYTWSSSDPMTKIKSTSPRYRPHTKKSMQEFMHTVIIAFWNNPLIKKIGIHDPNISIHFSFK